MKQRLLTVLALALLAIPAASPFFLPDVPRTNDLSAHLVRTFFFGRAQEWAGWWPRWSPDLVFGHGYPVFNFFPSLFHWATHLLHELGLPLLTAYRVNTFLHFWVAALGSYLLGRVVFRSPAAGWVAALVYTYSPYLLYDAHVRGSAPETQALALLPWLVLALWQSGECGMRNAECGINRQSSIVNRQSGGWILATAVLFALAFLSHPIIYQILIPIGLWLLLRGWFAGYGALPQAEKTNRGGRGGRGEENLLEKDSALSAPSAVKKHSSSEGKHPRLSAFIRVPFSAAFWQTLIGPIIGIGLGGLLVAFFWLPAFAEVGFVQADRSISQGYAYQSNFLSLADMLRLPRLPADPALVNPPVVRALPLVGLLWAAILLPLRWRKLARPEREVAITWTAVLLLCVWLITPSSQFVWDHFPLLRLTFYPWRLLSMASLATAVLAGLSMVNGQWSMVNGQRPPLTIGNWQLTIDNSLLFLLTLLTITASVPWLYPPRQPMAETVDLELALAEELPPYLIGTTTLGEFLPQWVDELPPQEPAKSDLIAQNNPDRLEPSDGLTWTRLSGNPVAARYEVVAERPLTLTYRQFYFPGWHAWLNDAPLPITPSQPHGLISVNIPAGPGELSFALRNTPAQNIGWLISGLALSALAYLGMRSAECGVRNGSTPHSAFRIPHFPLALTAVLLWLFFTYVDTPLRRPTLLPDGVWGLPAMTPLDFAGELRLLTYEQSAQAIPADEPITLTLYWQPQREIGVPYVVGVQVRDAAGQQWQASADRPADWRFIGGDPWPLDGYRMDPFVVRLLDGTPPGAYHFHVGLVRADTGQTVAAHDLGGFVVTEPGRGERPLEDGMVGETAVAANLRLLGTRLDRREAAPGDPARVTTLWQVDGATPPTNQFILQLTQGDEIALTQTVTIAPDYPLANWRPGDRLRSETLLRLPASLPTGDYTWRILWGDQNVAAGNVRLTAPERSFTTPPLDTPINQTFGEIATLLGLSPAPPPPRPASPLPFTLVWQAEGETAVSYHIFAHLIDEAGNIIAQSDGEPANWTRPTTGWLPGEIVLDERALTLPDALPAGPLWLRVGLYDPATGARLAVDGEEFVLLELRGE